MDFGNEATKASFQTSLYNLGVYTIDLYLLHRACGDYYGVRRAFEELYELAQLAYRTLDTMKEFNVVPMACGPLDERKHNIFNHPLFSKIAQKYVKSCAQVALRWNEQCGVIIFPKSAKKERLVENLNIFDFKLDDEDKE